MKLVHALSLSSLAVLAGCDSGSTQTPANLLDITAENRERVDAEVLGVTSNFEFAYVNFLNGGFDYTIEGADGSESLIQDCDQGTERITLTGEGFDRNRGELSSSGRINWETTLENCLYDSEGNWQGWYGISYGDADIIFEWSGYDSSTERFDSYKYELRTNRRGYESFTPEDDIDSFWEYNGVMSSTTADSSYSNAFDVVYRSSELNYKGVLIETITPITGSLNDDFPTAGELLITGDGDSQVRYTVVPNGIEARLNGGQATLLTWQELSE